MNKYFITGIFLSFVLIFSCRPSEEESLERANKAAAEGDCRKAIETYTSLISQDQLVKESLYFRGQCYTQLKDHQKALEDFESIIDLYSQGGALFIKNENSPFDPVGPQEITILKAIHRRGQVLFYLGRYADAMSDFQTCIDNQFRALSNCYLWKGYCYEKTGNAARACDCFEKAGTVARNDQELQEARKAGAQYCKSNE